MHLTTAEEYKEINKLRQPRAGNVLLPMFFIIIVSLAACTREQKPQPRSKPPVPVTIAVAEQTNIPVQLTAIGNVEAYNTVAIKPQISGPIVQVHFREGQDVRKGDILFTIDQRPFEVALKQAEANLAKDLAQARNGREQAQRYAVLIKEGIVTQEQYDQLRTAADAFEATVLADRAAVENVRVQLGYCIIRSPLAGRTGNLMVQLGNLVKANDIPVLVTINQISPVYVTFTVPERELTAINARLANGKMPVEAVIPNDGQGADQGVISFLDNAVDQSSGTIRMKGTFTNQARRFWPGQFVTVALTLATRSNAVTVPSGAIQTGQQGQFVYEVGTDQVAKLRPVVTSVAYGGMTVIEKGLATGEMVVIDGQMRLSPGAKVAVNQSTKGAVQKSPSVGSGQGPASVPKTSSIKTLVSGVITDSDPKRKAN